MKYCQATWDWKTNPWLWHGSRRISKRSVGIRRKLRFLVRFFLIRLSPFRISLLNLRIYIKKGESAGGASVHLHMMSGMSRGKFSRAISASGSAYSSWTIMHSKLLESRNAKLARRSRCPQYPSKAFVDCLKRRRGRRLAVLLLSLFVRRPFLIQIVECSWKTFHIWVGSARTTDGAVGGSCRTEHSWGILNGPSRWCLCPKPSRQSPLDFYSEYERDASSIHKWVRRS